MSLWFHVRSAGGLLRRRKGPVVRMVTVAMIGTLWSVVGGSWFLATWRDIDRVAGDVRIDLLVRSEASDSAVREAVEEIRELPSADLVRFVRENEVWREFSNDVGAEEDLRAVVTMPRFIRIIPNSDAATMSQLTLMTSAILTRYGDVVHNATWPREYVRLLDSRRNDVMILAIIAGALSLIMFMLAVAYAFRAEIHAAGDDLRVGAILGASLWWTAMPHILVSLVAGALGLGLASALVAGAAGPVLERVPWFAAVRPDEVMLIVGGLGAVGIIVSLWQSLVIARRAHALRVQR